MRGSLSRVAGWVAALTLLVSTAITPSFAGGCAWKRHCCWHARHTAWHGGHWRAAYGGRYGWSQAVTLGVDDGQLIRATLGKYPYQDYGYNNGACIRYQEIYDQAGNLIGRRPFLAC
jgi:hypothetical protein